MLLALPCGTGPGTIQAPSDGASISNNSRSPTKALEGSVGKMPWPWRLRKNAPLVVMDRMPPFQRAKKKKKSLVSCFWLCQVVLDLVLSMNNQMGGQSATIQRTPRNPLKGHLESVGKNALTLMVKKECPSCTRGHNVTLPDSCKDHWHHNAGSAKWHWTQSCPGTIGWEANQQNLKEPLESP